MNSRLEDDLLPVTPHDAAALQRFADAVRQELGDRLVEITLYGSKARGEDTAESDLDVLVIVAGADLETKDRIIDCAFEANVDEDVFIAPLIIDRAYVEAPVWRITDLAIAVDRDGISL